MGSRLLLWFAVLLLLLLRLRPMLLSFMEVMDTELVWDMLVLAMVLDLAMLVLAMDMELQELPLLLSLPLLEDMLELAGMLPTLLVLSMLQSVRLRLSQRLKLMPVFCMEPMAMVPVLDMLVLDMLVLDMDILVLDMLDMVVMDLAMAVLAMLVLDTMARGLLMLSQRLMLVCTMEDMDMVLVLDMDIRVLDMQAMVVMDSAMEDTVLDMDVSSMVKQIIYASKSSKVIFLLFSALIWGRDFVFHVLMK